MSRLPPILEPAHPEEVGEIVRLAHRLVIRGAGSKPDLCDVTRAGSNARVLSTLRLNGIVEYQPEEYTVTALAGTPLAALQVELGRNRQYLPFDPPFVAAGATVGGAVASGLNGPGRARYGGLRDFILGVRMVDGNGRSVRGGGKVVKNAAGFDLAKLMVGSCGGLGVLTEVTFKVFPAPATTSTVTARIGDLDDLLTMHRGACLAGMELQALAMGSNGCLSVRLGGRQTAMPRRLERLGALLPVVETQVLAGAEEEEHWASLGGVTAERRSRIRVPLTLESSEAMARAFDALKRDGSRIGWTVIGAGAGGWIDADPGEVEPVSKALRSLALAGQAFHGPMVGRLGAERDSAFENRVLGVLDPRGVFVAAGLASADV